MRWWIAAALLVAVGCDPEDVSRDAAPEPAELECAALLGEWQRRVELASQPPCDRDVECLAVGQVGDACEGNHLVGHAAVHRATYQTARGPAYQAELAARCRDHAAAWAEDTPALFSRCRANRCELHYGSPCP